jgi:protein-tyrosine phosphatase
MYYVGKVRCIVQPYVNTTFSASQINDNIYLGDLASASNLTAMKEQGITHILSVFNGTVELYPEHFTYKIIHINDDVWVDISKYFDESIQFMDSVLANENNRLLIHCQRGVSRSVTLLLAYKVWEINNKQKINYENIDIVIDTCIKKIQSHRDIADPNEGFKKCVKKYICKLNNYDYFD